MLTMHGDAWEVEWEVPGEPETLHKTFASRREAEVFMSTDEQRFYSQQLFQSRIIREPYWWRPADRRVS